MPRNQPIRLPGGGPLSPEEALKRALAAHEQGDIKTADNLSRQLLLRFPHQAEALYLRGIIAHQQGKLSKAESHLLHTIKVAPTNPLGHGGLGVIRLTQGRLEDSVSLFKKALFISADQPHIHNNLGLALMGLGRLPEAAKHFNDALGMAPQYSDAWLNLGKLHQDEDQPEKASTCYKQALKFTPNMAEAHNNLGNINHSTGQIVEALACYTRAIDSNPNYVEAIFNKAIIQAEMGQIRDAIVSYRAVIKIDPHHVEALCALGEANEVIGQIAEAEDHYERAMKINLQKIPYDRIKRLHYMRGRILDRLKDFDRAFDEFKNANELRLTALHRAGRIYNRKNQENLVDQIIANFPSVSGKKIENFGLSANLPIFVLGMPRSGTTLAEQILASHPQIYGAGELLDFPRVCKLLTKSGNWPDGFDQLDHSFSTKLAEDYISTLKKKAPEMSHVVDKLPTNYLYLGLIRTILPNATIIHTKRDSRDVCLSNYFRNPAEMIPHNHNLSDLGHYYSQYERLMAHWDQVFPGTIFHLDYEKLVQDQEATSRKLIDWIGLEWSDRCMAFHKTDRIVQTASYLQVRRPIYRDSIGRWRNYKNHLAPLNEALKGVQ